MGAQVTLGERCSTRPTISTGSRSDEFTAARDALAKRLRGEKRREDADFVKGLKRPSVAAGAINLAVREHGADDLLAAGEELRAAHGALLDGSGDAAAVRDATAREREAVRDFARLALGDDASAATEEKVRATLHAASVDDDVRELLEAGRLEREAEAGVDAMALMASAAVRRTAGGSAAEATAGRRRSQGLRRRQVLRRREARAAARRLRRRQGAQSRPVRGRAAAGGGRARAPARRRKRRSPPRTRPTSVAERARAALEEVEEAARKARAVVEDLEGQERQARRAVKEAEADAERRRTEARRAVKTAEVTRLVASSTYVVASGRDRRTRSGLPHARLRPRLVEPRLPRARSSSSSATRSSCWRSASRVWSMSGGGARASGHLHDRAADALAGEHVVEERRRRRRGRSRG